MQHVSEADIRQRSVVELLLVLAPRLLVTCPLDLPTSSVVKLAPFSSWEKLDEIHKSW